MNHTELKNYAPQARGDFIQAVTDRAAFYGVTAAKIEAVTIKGDVAIIAGHAFPASVVSKRKKLVERIERCGFNQTMEELAYTWFNRFVAIRFMELHGYLEHGYRVLSHPDPTKTIPEILELAEHVDLPGLRKEKVIDLKLDGNKESELYQMLLLAQCHALHSAMPFLFEGIDDETELVLPENLLHSDSIIRKLVAASDPEDWQEVEVLGWLYQFYISERKDEVMARKSAVPTEDIPAVTQLFTPHWIVRYLVENSLGRLWLLNRPGSNLREHMPYYIEGEAETDFLKITKPEDIRLLDPACGSGHMLTYAFDLLFLIYEEEGYVPSEIPALILRHNLHGLEICPRAAQLAGMALVFKARAKSPRFLQPASLVPPRILALQNIRFDEAELRDYIDALDLGDLFNEPLLQLLHQFEEATTLGSLIQPCVDEVSIVYARQSIEAKDLGSQIFLRETQGKVLRVLEQAEMLCQRYQIVVANPPYMGRGAMNSSIASFAETVYPKSKADLFAMFIERNVTLLRADGFCGMVTMQSWMFLPTFEALRRDLLVERRNLSMAHLGARGFDTISGEVVQTTAFVLGKQPPGQASTTFCRLIAGNSEREKEELFLAGTSRFVIRPSALLELPKAAFAYWLSPQIRSAYAAGKSVEQVTISDGQTKTGDNDRFLRQLWEISASGVGFGRKWVLHPKGGGNRKWYGNTDFVIDWSEAARIHYRRDHVARILPEYLWHRRGICWSNISTSSWLGFRLLTADEIFNLKSPALFLKEEAKLSFLLGFLNTPIASYLVSSINPTISFNVKDVQDLPLRDFPIAQQNAVSERVDASIAIARQDWDNFETSWDFRDQPLLRPGLKGVTLETSWRNWEAQSVSAIRRMQELETENNRLFIDAYGLAAELRPEVPEEQITLARANACRDTAAFLSYAVGCMMGRYSLDALGLILADPAHTLEEYLSKVGKPSNQLAFVPGEHGIIPVLDGQWFEGDIVTRIHSFLRAGFGEANLESNLRFIEESLGKDLRKYFLTEFYKDHLQTYKKRPIYWLFSSGKERAFNALVYLHRYHEGTLPRMRTEYVIPLQGKIASRIDQLADDIQKATSTSHRKKMEKERDKLLRQRTELQAFDEKLRHYADQRIQLDLDDGVKVNYGKFGDLLAEVNAVTGGSDE